MSDGKLVGYWVGMSEGLFIKIVGVWVGWLVICVSVNHNMKNLNFFVVFFHAQNKITNAHYKNFVFFNIPLGTLLYVTTLSLFNERKVIE